MARGNSGNVELNNYCIQFRAAFLPVENKSPEQIYLDMLYLFSGCLPSQNGSAKIPHSKGTSF